MKADRLRTINEPQRVEVELDEFGRLVGIRDAGRETRAVEETGEIWRIDDEWWRLPISRRCVEVFFEGGGRVVLFEDLITGEWWIQKP
jgi:YD repeat-containing protein